MSHFIKVLITSAVMTGQALASSIPMYELPVAGGQPGETYKMLDHKNSIFVFESLRLDCSYCNQNAPAVDQLATEMAANPRVQVLDLCIDQSVNKCEDWAAIHKPNHPVLRDQGFAIFNALKTMDRVPQVFVVDCNGTMVGNFVGSWESGGATIVRDLITKANQVVCP